MIYRRYGTSYQSVDTDFDANALNDIGFRRNREHAVEVDELERSFSKIETVELTADAEGSVQTETKQLLLDRLLEKLNRLDAGLPEGGLLVVENESGHDYPKTRQATSNEVDEGQNRLHFDYSVHPPLRVSLYRPSS